LTLIAGIDLSAGTTGWAMERVEVERSTRRMIRLAVRSRLDVTVPRNSNINRGSDKLPSVAVGLRED
jgi:hypothetical protein